MSALPATARDTSELSDVDGVAREIGDWLANYRSKEGITQSELARRLGWKQSVLARLESGEHAPRFATLQHIAATLRVRVNISISPEGVVIHFVRPRIYDPPKPTPLTRRHNTHATPT
jgi:transcriptional regulator with XRE-family HTH domain